jgi:hypothetical protein
MIRDYLERGTEGDPMITRRSFLVRTAGLVALGAVARRLGSAAPALAAASEAPGPVMTVYKSSTCGCCAKWVDHVRAAGFQTVVHDEEAMDRTKDLLGVPAGVRSCHTALVQGYVIEGHVPAADIRRFLKAPLKVMGLAVPGMPAGSPGMEQPGRAAEPYNVLAFQKSGATQVFARH